MESYQHVPRRRSQGLGPGARTSIVKVPVPGPGRLNVSRIAPENKWSWLIAWADSGSKEMPARIRSICSCEPIREQSLRDKAKESSDKCNGCGGIKATE